MNKKKKNVVLIWKDSCLLSGRLALFILSRGRLYWNKFHLILDTLHTLITKNILYLLLHYLWVIKKLISY